MATEAQTSANRSNAQKSTGPRTPEGKAVVGQNAVKHGLLAREVVIKGEDPQAFALYREGILEELAPAGRVESMLAERIVGLSWRLRRAERLQGAAVGTLAEEKLKWVWSEEDKQFVILHSIRPGPTAPGSEDETLAVDRKIVKDFAELRIFDRLLVYERRIEHSLYRTMAELRNLRKENGASSLKYGVSSAKLANLTSSPPDLPTSHCLPPTSGGTLDGGTTNVWEAESETCETNPICEEVSSSKCEVASEESQAVTPLGLPTSNFTLESAAEPQSCETNPIGVGLDEEQDLCVTGVMSDPAPRGLGETKPISAGANQGRAGYTPIFRRRR
jgi:hypothetical protein